MNFTVEHLSVDYEEKTIEGKCDGFPYIIKVNNGEVTTRTVDKVKHAVIEWYSQISGRDFSIPKNDYSILAPSFKYYTSRDEILSSTVKRDLSEYKKEMDKAINSDDFNRLMAAIEEVHESLNYCRILSEHFTEYYKLEYLKYLIESSEAEGYMVEEAYKNQVSDNYNAAVDFLYDNISTSIEVWLLRELYYIRNVIHEGYDRATINSDIRLKEMRIFEAISCLYRGEFTKLNTLVFSFDYEDADESTSLSLYMENYQRFKKGNKLNRNAAVNYFIHIAHNNGCMHDKIILRETGDTEYFLNVLSKGHFIPECRVEFFKATRIYTKRVPAEKAQLVVDYYFGVGSLVAGRYKNRHFSAEFLKEEGKVLFTGATFETFELQDIAKRLVKGDFEF